MADSTAIAWAATNDSKQGVPGPLPRPAQSSVGTEMQFYPCK
jgi:hypothetical protein